MHRPLLWDALLQPSTEQLPIHRLTAFSAFMAICFFCVVSLQMALHGLLSTCNAICQTPGGAMSKRRPGSKYYQTLNQRHWQAVRWAVLKRDGFRCQACGKAGRLEVHHRTALQDGGKPYDLANLVAYCRGCHVETHRPSRPIQEAWAAAVDELMPARGDR